MTQKRYTEIPRRFKSIASDDPYVAGSEDIEATEGKTQKQLNEETDERIATEVGRAQQAESTLDGKIAAEKTRAEGVEGGLNTRLQTVEALAEISVGGGDIGIGTSADFESDDPEDLAKVPTISAMLGGTNDGVYDISARHNGTKYADLAAALGTNGANIPVSLRKGGMSIKYVQTSDNKYVQYRLMVNAFSTTESDWQGIDDELITNSKNLVESGGISKAICDLLQDFNTSSLCFINYTSTSTTGYNIDGTTKTLATNYYENLYDNVGCGIYKVVFKKSVSNPQTSAISLIKNGTFKNILSGGNSSLIGDEYFLMVPDGYTIGVCSGELYRYNFVVSKLLAQNATNCITSGSVMNLITNLFQECISDGQPTEGTNASHTFYDVKGNQVTLGFDNYEYVLPAGLYRAGAYSGNNLPAGISAISAFDGNNVFTNIFNGEIQNKTVIFYLDKSYTIKSIFPWIRALSFKVLGQNDIVNDLTSTSLSKVLGASMGKTLNDSIQNIGLFYLLTDSDNPAIEITYSRDDVADLVVRQKAGKFRIFGRNLIILNNISSDIDNPFTDSSVPHSQSQGFVLVYDVANEKVVMRDYTVFNNTDLAIAYPNGYIVLGFGSLLNNGQYFWSIGDISINGVIYRRRMTSDNNSPFAPYVDKENFEVEVVCNNTVPSDYLSEDNTLQEPIIGHDRCVLVLPTTYTPEGTPTKLVLAAHGGGSEITVSSNPAVPVAIWKYMVSLGYAVLECNGMPYDFAETYGLDKTRQVGNYIAVQSYKKAYEYVINKYNIDRNGCYMCGWSQGGMVSLNVGDISGIPIKALGLEAPVVSMLKQWDIYNPVTIGGITYTKPARLNLAKLFGFIALNSTPSDADILALEFDESKLLGYDPYTRNVLEPYMSNTEPSNITSLTMKKFNHVPFKIWIAKDDGVMIPNALHQRVLVQAVKNAGGVADIHYYPNSSTSVNSHMLHEVQTPIGTFSYKGTTTNLLPFVYEMAQWFECFGGYNVEELESN